MHVDDTHTNHQKRWRKAGTVFSSRVLSFLPVCALLVLHGVIALSSVCSKSATFDELAHVTAGYSYWKTGDYRLHPENGNLPQRLAATPLLFWAVEFPSLESELWWKANVWGLGQKFLYRSSHDPRQIMWWGRTMITLVSLALGLVVYVWSRQLFGVTGGVISLIAYVFSPTILAHSRLTTSDLVCAFAFLTTLGCWWMVLHCLRFRNVVLSSLALGGLFVSKMSAILVLPVMLILLAMRWGRRRRVCVQVGGSRYVFGGWRQTSLYAALVGIHLLVVYFVIWSFFGFRYEAFRSQQPGRDQMRGGHRIESLTDRGLMGTAIRWAAKSRALPEAYLHGFAFTLAASKSRPAFLNGQYSKFGWRTYFPYCVLVKTSLPIFGLSFMALWGTLRCWRARQAPGARSRLADLRRHFRRGLYRTAPLWVFLVFYWVIAINSNLNIGHRHVLPTYPMVFILCGASAYWFRAPSRAMRVVVVVLLLLLAADSLAVHPNYLAYFNQLVGGPKNGYRHLVDSSLDWGQDLPGLRRWLEENKGQEGSDVTVYLSYFGSADPAYHRIHARLLPCYAERSRTVDAPLEKGIYCISATQLQCVYSPFPGPWTEAYERQYQALRTRLQKDGKPGKREASVTGSVTDDPTGELRGEYNQLRFSRLCAYLRKREPDDQVGYSILIYRLSEEDVARALDGAAPR